MDLDSSTAAATPPDDALGVPTLAAPLTTRLAVALAAAVGLGLSAGLLLAATTNAALPGCGAAGDCAALWTSRWGQLLGVPVSALAIATFATLLAVVPFTGRASPPAVRRVAAGLLLVLTAASLAAGGWFTAIAGLALGRWCGYCLAVHACSLAAFLATWRWRGLAPRPAIACLGLGVVSVVLVAAVQVVQPEPRGPRAYRVDPADALFPTEPPLRFADVAPHAGAAPAEREDVVLLAGRLRLDVAARPWLGDPQRAPVRVAKLYDYTCSHCRRLHEQLAASDLVRRGEVAIALLPTPLEPACNPYVERSRTDHAGACELTRLALAVWRGAPDQFAAFDAFLWRHAEPGSLAAVRDEAARVLGADGLAAQLADPTLERIVAEHARLYDALGREIVPQLLLPAARVVGRPRTEAELERLLREHSFPAAGGAAE